MLTIPGHILPQVVEDALTQLLPKNMDFDYKVLHELGKDDYKHTHVVVLLYKRCKLTSTKKWSEFRSDLPGYNLKPISTDEHFMNAICYDKSIKKCKTPENSVVAYDSIGDWEAEIPFHILCIEFIQKSSKWKDLLVNPEFSKYISSRLNWAREVYMHARVAHLFDFPSGKAFPWQETFIDFFDTAPDNRTIHWVFDRIGGNGKSDLTNWLLSHKEAFLVDSGKLSDIAYAYDNQPIVIFDLARDTEDYCPYRAMEAFKNGRFFSPKYTSCLKVFKPPHVVVFANYEADLSKLSFDRWDCISLDDFKISSNPISTVAERKKLKGSPHNVKGPPENLSFENSKLPTPNLPIVFQRCIPSEKPKEKSPKPPTLFPTSNSTGEYVDGYWMPFSNPVATRHLPAKD